MIDGVFGGHTHSVAHHFINDIPVVISSSFTKYLSIMYFKFDLIKNKILDDTTIEGPIPLCDKVFSKNNICD